MADNDISIDLSNASRDELLNIRNEVMRRLAERAHSTETVAEYDRHGSGHSRSKPPVLTAV